jgi:Cu/Ag efflux protein CusF
VQGRVKAIEMTQKVITLDNGTRLFWTDDIPIAEQIQSGDLVKVRFEERGGRLVLTDIEIVV